MTCEEFEKVVTDLACEFLIEAAARKRGLAHARACVRCAARLQQERALTAALNATAGAEIAQAPARVKTALLAAFHGQATPAPVIAPLSALNESPRRRARWLMAMAAALMLAAILVALQVLRQSSQAEPADGPQATSLAESTTANTAAPSVRSDVDNAAQGPGTAKKEDVRPAPQNDRAGNLPKVPRRRFYRPVYHPELAAAPNETVTEFIPLTAIAESTAMGSGTIVRVEMPRASLIALGLPMNAERALETVRADIVVGDDGLARAIRLVY